PGKYVWKSFYTGPEGAWTQGAFLGNKPPRGHELDPLVPLNYLIWYNRHPQAGKWMAGVTPGAPFGLHGVSVLMASDEANMAKHYREALDNPAYTRGLDGEGLAGIINEIGVIPEIKERFAKPYKPLDPL